MVSCKEHSSPPMGIQEPDCQRPPVPGTPREQGLGLSQCQGESSNDFLQGPWHTCLRRRQFNLLWFSLGSFSIFQMGCGRGTVLI